MKEEGRFRTWYWWLILGAAMVVALGIGLMVGTVRESPREAVAPVEGLTLADVAPALPEEAVALPYTSDILGLDELLASVVAPGPVIVDLGDLGIISLSDLQATADETAVVPTLEGLGELDFPGYNPLDISTVELSPTVIPDIGFGLTVVAPEEFNSMDFNMGSSVAPEEPVSYGIGDYFY